MGWSLTSLAFVAVTGFASTYFNARSLGVEGLGSYVTVLALSLMLEVLAGMQCWQAVLALPDKGEDEARIFGAALAMNLTSGVVAVCVGLAVAFALQLEGGWVVYLHLATLVLRVPEPATGILRRRDQFDFIAIARMVTASLSVLTAFTLWRLEAELESYIMMSALIQVASAGMLLSRGIHACKPAWPSARELKRVVGFSLPTGGSGAIGAMRTHGIVLLLSAIAGPVAVGLYAVADRIASVMQMVYRAGFEAVFREINGAKKPLELIVKFALACLVVAAGACAFVLVFGEILVVLVAGEQFAPASAILLLLVLAAGAPLVTLGLRAWIIIEIGPRTMFVCNLIALTSLAMAPWLISNFDAAGAAFAQLAFEMFWIGAALTIAVRSRKLFRQPRTSP